MTYIDPEMQPVMHACVKCSHKFVPLDLEMERDASRYRWLLAKLAEAYDSNTLDLPGGMIADARLLFQRKGHRRIEASLSWGDESGESIGLSAAIDGAMNADL